MENTVELIGYYGSDEIIACSAWTSTSRDLTEDKIERIPALIDRLWKSGHETPFEKGIVHFLVDTDIATHIHLLKHRMSSLNGESARYKELKEDKYYLPHDWDNIFVSEDFCLPTLLGEKVRDDGIIPTWLNVLEWYTQLGNRLYHQCVTDLAAQLGRKRAKESSRFFKTYNSQIQSDVMFNMRSFANFLSLRNSEHAQVEIREVAKKMKSIVAEIEGNPFKYTLTAFEERDQ